MHIVAAGREASILSDKTNAILLLMYNCHKNYYI